MACLNESFYGRHAKNAEVKRISNSDVRNCAFKSVPRATLVLCSTIVVWLAGCQAQLVASPLGTTKILPKIPLFPSLTLVACWPEVASLTIVLHTPPVLGKVIWDSCQVAASTVVVSERSKTLTNDSNPKRDLIRLTKGSYLKEA